MFAHWPTRNANDIVFGLAADFDEWGIGFKDSSIRVLGISLKIAHFVDNQTTLKFEAHSGLDD